jgi:hypothetical protein
MKPPHYHDTPTLLLSWALFLTAFESEELIVLRQCCFHANPHDRDQRPLEFLDDVQADECHAVCGRWGSGTSAYD